MSMDGRALRPLQTSCVLPQPNPMGSVKAQFPVIKPPSELDGFAAKRRSSITEVGAGSLGGLMPTLY